MNTKIIYIIGYGHSGSTLLDVLLGTSKSIQGCGELSGVIRHGVQSICSCGASVKDCRRWGPVIQNFLDKEGAGAMDNLQRYEKQFITRVPLWLHKKHICNTQAQEKELYHYHLLLRAFYESLSTSWQADWIVDSSKNPIRAWHVSQALDDHMVFVHLVRDVRAVVWSLVRRGRELKQMSEGKTGAPSRGWIRGLLAWLYFNNICEKVLKECGSKSMRLRYEDIMNHTIPTFDSIAEFIDVADLKEVAESAFSGHSFPVEHRPSGNRLRLNDSLKVRNDDEWKKILNPCLSRNIYYLAYSKMKKYGYE